MVGEFILADNDSLILRCTHMGGCGLQRNPLELLLDAQNSGTQFFKPLFELLPVDVCRAFLPLH